MGPGTEPQWAPAGGRPPDLSDGAVPSGRRCGWTGRAVLPATGWALGQGGMARVEAWVEPDDTPSQQLLTVCGFVP